MPAVLIEVRRRYTPEEEADEIDRENWGVGGGHAASDVDLGFTVEV